VNKSDRFKGCIIGGAIGDAWGSGFENQFEEEDDTFYLVGNPHVEMPRWGITDDTQLTIATIEAMLDDGDIKPESLVREFLILFRSRELRGIGSTTLKALRELDIGGHWSQVGRKDQYAAGNGAAMRIAPLAFRESIQNSLLRDLCSITHNNDEAYIGARCIVIAIREILNENWKGHSNLIELIIEQIPDTLVRDRLILIKDIDNLNEVGGKGKDGFVVNSIPLALAAANKVNELGIELMYSKLIEIGGDTDTNCSIAGQIAGTLIGIQGIPSELINKLKCLRQFNQIDLAVNRLIEKEGWI